MKLNRNKSEIYNYVSKTIKAYDLAIGNVIKFGKEIRRVKELNYVSNMVQITFEDTNPKSKRINHCVNVIPEFEFILISNCEDETK